MHHAGRIVSRGEIVEHLYDQDFDRDSNTIEVFVGRLRKKLGVEIIQTVRGLGYIWRRPKRRIRGPSHEGPNLPPGVNTMRQKLAPMPANRNFLEKLVVFLASRYA
jgi:DNA-binding winged helix-turn-helix (wHTH) protein